MSYLRAIVTLGLFGCAAWAVPATDQPLREFSSWFARPARLPFAWNGVDDARARGDAQEAFARGQQLLELLPSWTLGHAAFAYRYALTQDQRGTADEIAAAAHQRLNVAFAWLEQARAHAGARELELLQSAAFLAPIACANFPGLEARLPEGGAAAMTDAYFEEAEREFPSAAVQEQRLFHFPTLAAALLESGQRSAALAVLDTAAARAAEARDQSHAQEWRDRVVEAAGRLRGAPERPTAVLADRRFEPLWPHLR